MATQKGARRPAKKRPAPQRRERQQPESLRLRSLSVSLTVTDLTRSLAWYRDVLRFTPGEQWRNGGQLRGVQLKAGTCEVMLSQDDFAKGRDRRKGDGVRIWLSTAQDIDALAAGITARGGHLDYAPQDMPWGDRAFAITDPDGFKITVVQE
ncbi:MAG TPA: VOC family protein [Gemmatimonadales bacterium]|jgi:catechol 2,3-dioxygenase-like lactoylglutathione lyase family enzyme|nr:VOC family protein [Gemmatimonadales bacterium]